MLAIRARQMEALGEVTRLRFEDQLVAHVAESLPQYFQQAGAAVVRARVRLGIKRAALYGFQFEHCVAVYVKLMILFGDGYDTDPKLGWPQRVLSGKEYATEQARAEALADAAREYLKALAEREGEVSR